MNQSIQFFSKSNIFQNNSPFLTNPSKNNLFLNKLHISKSFSTFLYSKNQKYTKLFHSDFKYFLNSIIISESSDSNSFYEITDCSYSHTTSSTQGSALFFNDNLLQLQIHYCEFHDCYSSSRGSSSARGSECTGGAIFIQVKTTDMYGCYFSECLGEGHGQILYVCGELNSISYFSCLCDYQCGKSGSGPFQSLYSFELLSSHVKDINSPHGALHFGMYPSPYSLIYANIFFNQANCYAIGSSLQTATHISTYSHIVIKGCSNANGILTCWKGIFLCDYFHFINCNGQLIRQEQSFTMIFTNSIFPPSITINLVTTSQGCIISSLPDFSLQIKCHYYHSPTIITICSYHQFSHFHHLFSLIVIFIIL
jgi:hypothetical protein